MLRVVLAAALLAAPAAAQTLRVGQIGQQSGTLDPHRATATHDKGPASWMFDGLVRFPPGSADPSRLEPDLAERWERSADGLTWTFTLRDGVEFHHGMGRLTAEDVAFSLRRAASPASSAFAGDYRELAAVEVVDPRTVRVVFRQAVPNGLGLFANYHGGMIVSRRAAESEDFSRRPVGTGPFQFEAVEPGGLRLSAHRQHFRGTPKLAGVHVRFIPSDQTRELAYAAGELDLFIGRREQRWVERMRQMPNTVVEVFGPGEFRTLLLNTKSKPLDDVRVRRAVIHAIDVPAIVRFVGPDVAQLWPSPVPPGYLGAIRDVPTYPHDPARARALLAEAGLPQGVTLKAVVSSVTTQLPIMEVIQGQLRRAGITLEMDVVEHATYHARIRQDLSQVTFYGAARFPVADSYLTQFYHSRSAPGQPTMALNFAHCSAADAEIDAARSEPDPQKQLALWAAAQRKVMEAACSLPLYDLRQVWVRKSGVALGYTLEGSLNLAPPITAETALN
jgi:peptide/nickel transport system substrate-binding protein